MAKLNFLFIPIILVSTFINSLIAQGDSVNTTNQAIINSTDNIEFRLTKSLDENELGTIVKFSPDEKYIAVGGGNGPNYGLVNIYAISSGSLIKKYALPGYIRSICFSPNGRVFAIAADNIGVNIYDFKSGNLLTNLSGNSNPSDITFSQDGKYFGVATLRELYIYETTKLDQVAFRAFSRQLNNSIHFSPDGCCVALATSKGSYIFDISLNTIVRAFEEKISEQNRRDITLTYNKLGDKLAMGTLYDGIVYYDFSSKTQKEFFTGFTNTLSFSADGKYLIMGMSDNGAKVFNTESGLVVKSFTEEGFAIHDTQFSPQGNFLALSGNGKVRLYSIIQ